MTQDPNPHEALAAIQEARTGVASVADYPIGYDILYGAVCALLVAGPGLPGRWPVAVIPVAMAGLVWMMTAWRKKFGWWVNGYSPKKARWVAYGLGAVFLALAFLSVRGQGAGPDWLFLVSGALGFVAAIAGSRLWHVVWRRELAEGPQ
ncbi:MAG: hypothetical protein ACK4JY_03385 [Brevundimonas sp.]|uniref:hypothetical protein n=1 Tax=Brevundimonas sp. TaxID=1871086 RepID=UPI003919211A